MQINLDFLGAYMLKVNEQSSRNLDTFVLLHNILGSNIIE